MTEPDPPEPSDPAEIAPADAELLAELQAALGREEMPDDLVAISRQLLAVGELDGELTAFLIENSKELSGVRSAGADTADDTLVFEVPEAELVVEVSVAFGSLEITVDPAVQSVDLERPSGAVRTVELDTFGSALVHGVEPGPTRLRVLTPGGVVVTEWFIC